MKAMQKLWGRKVSDLAFSEDVNAAININKYGLKSLKNSNHRVGYQLLEDRP